MNVNEGQLIFAIYEVNIIGTEKAWWLDTGASCHAVYNKTPFSNYRTTVVGKFILERVMLCSPETAPQKTA